MKLILILLIFFSLTPFGFAKGNLGSHVHGAAALDLAIDGKQLLIMFKSPADSILGFEHKPINDSQKKVLKRAKTQWQKNIFELIGSDFFKKCKTSESSWQQKFSGAKHSEVIAEVLLNCHQKVSGQSLEISLKKKYPKIENIHLQMIREDGSALSKKFTAKSFKIKL